MNELFMKKLAIDELHEEPKEIDPNNPFDEDKHYNLYWTINQMSS